MADCDVLYIEEPVPQLDQCIEFTRMTGIGFALDETLRHTNYQFEWHKGLQALIVKPMLMGGIEKIMKIAHDAHSHRIPTIISSSYESSLGLTMLANLAAAIDSDPPVGLDTYGMFQYDLQESVFCPKKGTLSLESLESRKKLHSKSSVSIVLAKQIGFQLIQMLLLFLSHPPCARADVDREDDDGRYNIRQDMAPED